MHAMVLLPRCLMWLPALRLLNKQDANEMIMAAWHDPALTLLSGLDPLSCMSHTEISHGSLCGEGPPSVGGSL